MMIHTITVRELRPKLSEVLKSVHEGFERYVITRRGHPEAIMLSVLDYESLLETIEIQSDKPLMKRIRKAENDLHKGQGIDLETIKKELKIV